MHGHLLVYSLEHFKIENEFFQSQITCWCLFFSFSSLVILLSYVMLSWHNQGLGDIVCSFRGTIRIGWKWGTSYSFELIKRSPRPEVMWFLHHCFVAHTQRPAGGFRLLCRIQDKHLDLDVDVSMQNKGWRLWLDRTSFSVTLGQRVGVKYCHQILNWKEGAFTTLENF